jgi:hypothetical protein
MTIKIRYWVSGILAAGLLAVAGCGKANDVGDRAMPQAIDLPKFQQAFPAPTPAQQESISKASDGVRYGLYPQALAALDKLTADPALTEVQKQAVTDLVQGIKQTMAKAPAPAAK